MVISFCGYFFIFNIDFEFLVSCFTHESLCMTYIHYISLQSCQILKCGSGYNNQRNIFKVLFFLAWRQPTMDWMLLLTTFPHHLSYRTQTLFTTCFLMWLLGLASSCRWSACSSASSPSASSAASRATATPSIRTSASACSSQSPCSSWGSIGATSR